MPYGYHGKILHVNLTTGALTVEQPDDAWYRLYMGGSNFGLYYILKHMPPGADALGPDNVLTVMLSVVTGVAFSGQSRMTLNAKSPLSGAIGDSQAGGFSTALSSTDAPKHPFTCGFTMARPSCATPPTSGDWVHGRPKRACAQTWPMTRWKWPAAARQASSSSSLPPS